jgi:hypothetical protein
MLKSNFRQSQMAIISFCHDEIYIPIPVVPHYHGRFAKKCKEEYSENINHCPAASTPEVVHSRLSFVQQLQTR